MPDKDLYQLVIDEFNKTGSVKRTAENLGTTLVRAQRILITEGLWSSPTSEKICELFYEGYTVPEIASELFVSEKTVQAYLPYSRTKKGYGEEKSVDALKSEDYRLRMHQAAESQVLSADLDKEKEEMKELRSRETQADLATDEELGRKTNKEILEKSLEVSQLYGEHMKEHPEVLKLHLELKMEHISEEDMEILRKFGKVKEGITRDILVPEDITLHALNYAILRAFGWQNSHLHHFQLPAKVFQELTGGKEEPEDDVYFLYDGLFMNWVKLCGIYFRFPTEDFEDIYWDDDYKEGQSVKSWFRRKYTGPYRYGGESEHYRECQYEAQAVVKRNPQIRNYVSFDDYLEDKKTGKKRASEFIPIEKASIKDLQSGFESGIDELLERIPLIQLLIPQGIQKDKSARDQIDFLCRMQAGEMIEYSVVPIADHLNYLYDYGDGWRVKITMPDCYYIQKGTAYNMDNEPQDIELTTKILEVKGQHRPQCIALDGMSLMDDVGGVHGYIDFLETIKFGDPEEREQLRGWAKYMGWTGRMNKPETLL